jgi:hypothetical protein
MFPPKPTILDTSVTVPPEAVAVTYAPGSLFMEVARLKAMLAGVVPEPAQLAVSA